MITTTERLTGKGFEKVLDMRHDEYREARVADIGRYGVQCVHTGAVDQGGQGMVAIQSLPDYEGPVRDAISDFQRDGHVIFDAKACSAASFDLSKYRAPVDGKPKSKRRQLTHMYKRAEYGMTCFFLVHWNERELSNKTIPPQTWIFPVHSEMTFWQRFEAAEVKRFNLEDCQNYGVEVQWNRLGQARTPRPDWLAALKEFPF